MSDREWCLHAEHHTPCPDGYLAWHAWAEKMARTHVQVQCAEIISNALGVGTFDPLTCSTAAVIYAFDQEALEQSWERLSEYRRQPYYDIAEAVLQHVRGRRA